LFCPAVSVFPPSFLPSFLCTADAFILLTKLTLDTFRLCSLVNDLKVIISKTKCHA
jgi:hypothetical protein